MWEEVRKVGCPVSNVIQGRKTVQRVKGVTGSNLKSVFFIALFLNSTNPAHARAA